MSSASASSRTLARPPLAGPSATLRQSRPAADDTHLTRAIASCRNSSGVRRLRLWCCSLDRRQSGPKRLLDLRQLCVVCPGLQPHARAPSAGRTVGRAAAKSASRRRHSADEVVSRQFCVSPACRAAPRSSRDGRQGWTHPALWSRGRRADANAASGRGRWRPLERHIRNAGRATG